MSDTTTIRVDRDVHAALKSIAEDEGQTLSDTLRTLVEAHRRDRLFNQSDRAYQRLRDDEDAWTEVEEERRDLEGTQADGLGENNA
jgi:predicted CopG family antitoxin